MSATTRWTKVPPDRPGWWWVRYTIPGSSVHDVSPRVVQAFKNKRGMLDVAEYGMEDMHRRDLIEWSDRPVEPPGEGE